MLSFPRDLRCPLNNVGKNPKIETLLGWREIEHSLIIPIGKCEFLLSLHREGSFWLHHEQHRRPRGKKLTPFRLTPFACNVYVKTWLFSLNFQSSTVGTLLLSKIHQRLHWDSDFLNARFLRICFTKSKTEVLPPVYLNFNFSNQFLFLWEGWEIGITWLLKKRVGLIETIGFIYDWLSK